MKRSLLPFAFLLTAVPLAAQVPCGPPDGVTVTVDPPVAAVGEPINITLTNNSGTLIEIPSGCLWATVFPNDSCSGPPVLNLPCLPVITPIPSGTSLSMAWDQKDDSGQQVPPGTYSTTVGHFTGFCCVTMTIVGSVPVMPAWALGAMVGLLAWLGAWMVRRRAAQA